MIHSAPANVSNFMLKCSSVQMGRHRGQWPWASTGSLNKAQRPIKNVFKDCYGLGGDGPLNQGVS